MKALPTVVVSRDGVRMVEVVSFDGLDRVANRDAVGYYFSLTDAAKARVRVGVVFSGTVMAVQAESFSLPAGPDRQSTFANFAIAALGDYLDDHLVPEPTPSGASAHLVECFSPHFQSWVDRPPATDEEVEAYLTQHLYWAWKLGQESWELGAPDLLRLHRTMEELDRLIGLGEDEEWGVTARTASGISLRPTKKLLRDLKIGGPPSVVKSQDGSPEPIESESSPSEPPSYGYVDEARIAALRGLADSPWDLRKVLAICEELNLCYRSQCYHAVAALTRSLIDHVPPIFGCKSFAEVASSYNGGRSFKECMQRLQDAARKIADMHLHQQIRDTESLPTRTQVNFSNELDLLLAEVVRVLESRNSSGA